MLVIEVLEGELLEEIETAAKDAGLADAAIVSLIGAVDDFTISSMPLTTRRETSRSTTPCPP